MSESKSITLELVEFLELITYKQLFHYVDLPSTIAAKIALADPDHQHCYCEPMDIDTTAVWYPIESWIDECKRKKYLEEVEAEYKRMYVLKLDKEKLKKDLLKAALDGDIAEVERITGLLKEKV